MWNSDELDLDGYLTRLGHEGDRSPTLANLRALHRAHVLNARWDNLSAYLHGDVPLDLPTLQRKMITGRGGGYCFEHVTLFAALLEALGYRFFVVQGRVVMGSSKILPTTHAMLVVEFDDGSRWLCDVGFGASMLEPVELVEGPAGVQVEQDAWTYRLRQQEVTPGAVGWAMYQPAQGPDTDDGTGWMVRHTVTLDPQYPVDLRTSNFFVALSPHSPFSRRLFVQRVLPDRLYVLDHLTLTSSHPDPSLPAEIRELEPHEAPKVLADVFDIETSEEDAALLVAKLTAP
ncbi:arylamine N-acetyltransferase family protein [Streptomyces sp. CA-294286]|uniref:arylamine N-acetyltransferase family protein n=1 Tax=Streptomyces sp. CA-294286 TaxID=3240070 RepID=UPI003D92BC9D